MDYKNMFNRSALLYFLLQVFISLGLGIYLTSGPTISNVKETVEQKIGETGGLTPRKSWTAEEKKHAIGLMKNWDTEAEKTSLGTSLTSEIPSQNTENAIKSEHQRIEPYGIEDYMFSEQDFLDLANSTNGSNSTGSENDVRFFLYTKKNSLNPDELFTDDMDAVINSNFIHNAPLKVLTSGFNSKIETNKFPAWLNASYLKPQTRDLNVILIDWHNLAAGPNYITVLHNLQIAAERIAKFIKFLVDRRVTTLEQVHVIGHSLGAHLAGDTGYCIHKLMGQKASRVTGLDPVSPVFALADERGRIDPSDGNFVDIIHTTGLELGFLRSLGHADFYVNGGLSQPGCSNLVQGKLACTHDIAHEYFSESVLYPMAFKACKCPENIVSGFSSCPCNVTDSIAYMGDYLSTSARGIYYLETNDKPLYGRG